MCKRARTPRARTKECGEGKESRPPCSPSPRAAQGTPRAQPEAPAGSSPHPQSRTGPGEERGAPLEVAMGRWRYVAPCRARRVSQ